MIIMPRVGIEPTTSTFLIISRFSSHSKNYERGALTAEPPRHNSWKAISSPSVYGCNRIKGYIFKCAPVTD